LYERIQKKSEGSHAVTEETRKDDAVDPQELTTADLAGLGDQKEQKLRLEPRIAAAQTSSDPRDRMAPIPSGAPAGTSVAAARAKVEEELSPLFSTDEANNLRAKWDSVQVNFVDEPRQAVEEADRLIAATMKRLAEIFAEERQTLEHQWDKGDNVSTEDLRIALRRYRSFFSRLLRV